MGNTGSTAETSSFRVFFFDKDNKRTPLLTIVFRNDKNSGDFDAVSEEVHKKCSLEFDFGLKNILRDMINKTEFINIMKHPLIISNQDKAILYIADFCVADHESKSFTVTLSKLLEGSYSFEIGAGSSILDQNNGHKTKYIRFISGDETYRIPTDIKSIEKIKKSLLSNNNPYYVIRQFREPQQSSKTDLWKTPFAEVTLNIKGRRYILFTRYLDMRDLRREDITSLKYKTIVFNDRHLTFYYMKFLRKDKVYSIVCMELPRNNGDCHLIQVSKRIHAGAIRKVLEDWNKKNENILIIGYNKELTLKTIYQNVGENAHFSYSLDILNMLTQRFQLLNYVEYSQLLNYVEDSKLRELLNSEETSIKHIKSLIKEKSIKPRLISFDIVKEEIKLVNESEVDVDNFLKLKLRMFILSSLETLRKRVRGFLGFAKDVFYDISPDVASEMMEMIEMEKKLRKEDDFIVLLRNLSDLIVSSFSVDMKPEESKHSNSVQVHAPSM